MLHIVFVLASAFAHEFCGPQLTRKSDSYTQARRIAAAVERVAAQTTEDVEALDELLSACRDVGFGRGRLERTVKLRLKTVIPTLTALLDEAEPARRWPIAYALTAMRAPESGIGQVHPVDQVSGATQQLVRREVETYLARKGQPLLTRVSVRRIRLDELGWNIELALELGNEFPLAPTGAVSGIPRLPLPPGFGESARVVVTVGALGAEVTGGAGFNAPIRNGALRVERTVRVRAPATTSLSAISLFLDVGVGGRPVGRNLITGAALAAASRP